MNKKGFVLVETIVTAVFVLGLFAFIIANILPLIGDYDRMRDYDSIESIYDAHMIRKMILKSDEARTVNLVKFPSGQNYYIFQGTDICLYLSNKNYCKKLLSRDYLDVKKIIVTNFNTSALKDKASSFERATAEYIKYMPKYNNAPLQNYTYQRRLIIEFNDGRFVNIELLLEANGGGETC